MSWNINIVGARAAVNQAVAQEEYVPQGIKDMVNKIAEATKPGFAGLRVKTSGHIDSTYGGGVNELIIEQVTVVGETAAASPSS